MFRTGTQSRNWQKSHVGSSVRRQLSQSASHMASALVVCFHQGVKLPHNDRAYVNIVKLRDYSLSQTHHEGKHKGRVFAAALGIGPEEAEWLRDCLLTAARELECQLGTRDEHGQRYTVDFTARF